ncbi:amidohydrolase family protein [Frankia sp. QA3]|uniref:amidohydrolase family protein n=1 Tax=Frankia sp. QA3 TaxID=710111 RepID=UPI000269BEC9|nr:amidohydrolase family protein [Frankia sp. QA3]EIV91910.1 putative TIM-barrel fold metal-dependent hydrolase [Frankia sp. QA3]
MQVEDLILISVDDHVVEPPTMFDAHIPAKYKDRAPHIVKGPNGGDLWAFEDGFAPNVGLNAVAGCPPEEYGLDPTEYAQMRPGCYDADERVRDMSAGGVLAGINFPTFPHFCGQLFLRAKDKDLALASVRAYNDWHIDEWAGSHPDRFIPISLPVLWDPELAAEEVRRVAAKGARAVTFSENPVKLGLPSYHSDYWDPFLRACADNNVVVCIHIGSSSTVTVTAPDAPPEVMISLTPVNSLMAVTDLVFSGIFKRIPNLQMALSEGGIGWLPYALERADYVYQHHHAWTFTDLGGKLPSQVFHDHIWTCFIDDPVGVKLREDVGVDKIMWELDYPHSDSTWPYGPEKLFKDLAGVSDDEINKITHENAMRAFDFNPFAHRPKEKSTVAALRAEAADVDIEPKSMGRRKAEADGGNTALLSSVAATGSSK